MIFHYISNNKKKIRFALKMKKKHIYVPSDIL